MNRLKNQTKIHTLLGQFILILGIVTSSVSYSSDKANTEQVQAQLVASVTAVEPGAEILLGVNQKIIPHWHTYWVNPGDSGNATTIDWRLPEGAIAGDIIWPIPQRFSMGPITNYAYENDVTLLTKIKFPEDIEVGKTISISAVVDWLVCAEECIPQQVQLSLELPIVAAGESVGNAHPFITDALSRLPVTSTWKVTATEILNATNEKELKLTIDIPQSQISSIQDIWFYPYDWGRIQQSAIQQRTDLADAVELRIKTGDAAYKLRDSVSGVLVVKEKTEDGEIIARGFDINPQLVLSNTKSKTENSAEESTSFVGAILLAFIGGIILNLMPCVFPVLSIKALSLVSHAAHSPRQLWLQGVVYTLGVIASFLLLALLLIILKAGGAQIGWGFQFQSPVFVLVVAYLVFAVGLSLSGVFFLGGSAIGVGTSLTTKPGYSGSFFTGVLATIVATPCTAPFMAAALGYALTQPAIQLIIIFISLALGLALPYLLLTCWPGLHRHLPQPGVWMERLKQFLAFPMYATAIWLVWVLIQQTGVDAIIYAAGGMLLIALAAWIYDSSQTAGNKKRIAGLITALAIILLVLVTGYRAVSQSQHVNKPEKQSEHGQTFSNQTLQTLLQENKPVFVNFTASWCISCLVNERVALSDVAVVKHFQDSNITYLKGDWTNRDQEITDFLKKFNRSGVPLYVFYPANQSDRPVVLPQILTPDLVIQTTQ